MKYIYRGCYRIEVNQVLKLSNINYHIINIGWCYLNGAIKLITSEPPSTSEQKYIVKRIQRGYELQLFRK